MQTTHPVHTAGGVLLMPLAEALLLLSSVLPLQAARSPSTHREEVGLGGVGGGECSQQRKGRKGKKEPLL